MHDNRKAIRYLIKKTCYLLVRDNPVIAYTFDVSQGGLTLLAPELKLAVGEKVKIRFHLDLMQDPVSVGYELRNIINKYDIKDPDALNKYKKFSVLRYRYGFALDKSACGEAELKAHQELLSRAQSYLKILETIDGLNQDILPQIK